MRCLLSMAKRCVAEPHALHIGCFYCAAVLGFQAALFANKKARFYQNLGRELAGVGGALWWLLKGSLKMDEQTVGVLLMCVIVGRCASLCGKY